MTFSRKTFDVLSFSTLRQRGSTTQAAISNATFSNFTQVATLSNIDLIISSAIFGNFTQTATLIISVPLTLTASATVGNFTQAAILNQFSTIISSVTFGNFTQAATGTNQFNPVSGSNQIDNFTQNSTLELSAFSNGKRIRPVAWAW